MERGSALATVLLTVALIMTLATAFLTMRRQDSRIAEAAFYAEQAYFAADAGLQYAQLKCRQLGQATCQKLQDRQNVSDDPGSPSFTLQGSAGLAANTVIITSTAEVKLPTQMGGSTRAHRVLRMQIVFDGAGMSVVKRTYGG